MQAYAPDKRGNRVAVLARWCLGGLLLLAGCRSAGPRAPGATAARGGYGHAADPSGQPTGGGVGYTLHPERRDHEAATAEAFLQILEDLAAQPEEQRRGAVVGIPSGVSLDFSGRQNVVIPSGVTVAGDRGIGGSPGPVLSTVAFPLGERTPVLFVLEEDARLTGLRIFGPDHAPRPDVYPTRVAAFGEQRRYGISLAGAGARIDNCEVAGFNWAGIQVTAQGRPGVVAYCRLYDVSTYPVVLGRGPDRLGSQAIIEGCDIEWLWHAIATPGSPQDEYIARYNHFKESPRKVWQLNTLDSAERRAAEPERIVVGAVFALDSHGSGAAFEIHHNTFEDLARDGRPSRSIVLRGEPARLARIERNWFVDCYRPPPEGFDALMERLVFDSWRTHWSRTGMVDGELRDPHIAARHARERPVYDALLRTPELHPAERTTVSMRPRPGANLWILDNAYGPAKKVIPVGRLSTTRIAWTEPRLHRRHDRRTPPAYTGDFAAVFELEPVPGREIKEIELKLNGEILHRHAHGSTGGMKVMRGDRPDGLYELRVRVVDSAGVPAALSTWFDWK